MKAKTIGRLAVIAITMMTTELSAQTKVQTAAQQVTLFIHGAQVSRSKQVDVPAGTTTFVFGGLSPYLDAKSLKVSATGRLTITAVNTQKNYLDSLSITNEYERLQKELVDAQKALTALKADVTVNAAEMQILKDNCALGNKQNTTPAAIKEIGIYYAAESKRLKAEELKLQEKVSAQNTIVDRLQKQMDQVSTKPARPVTEVSVKVNAPVAGKATFALTYYVENAGWFPTYDVRSDGPAAPLNITYKANMYQQTKEDWKNVTLTLSSSNPAQGNVAPVLKPYWLDFGLAAPTYDNASGNNQISGFVRDHATGEPLIGASVAIRGTTVGAVTDLDGHYSLTLPLGAKEITVSYIGYKPQTRAISGNSMNISLQEDESLLDEVVVVGYATMDQAVSGRVAGVESRSGAQRNLKKIEAPKPAPAPSMVIDVDQTQTMAGYEFEIKIPYTIPSENKQPIVAEINRFDLPANYLYQSTPKVDKDAFITAQTTRWQDYNLLEGEANVYFEQTFVGTSILNATQQSDTLSFSMGRDRGIRIERFKEKDLTSRQFIGSNQTQTIAWKIKIRNNRKEAVNLMVYDQLPVSRNKQITVTAEDTSGAQLDENNGRLTWDLTLQAGEQQELILRYKVKYPKGSRLALE